MDSLTMLAVEPFQRFELTERFAQMANQRQIIYRARYTMDVEIPADGCQPGELYKFITVNLERSEWMDGPSGNPSWFLRDNRELNAQLLYMEQNFPLAARVYFDRMFLMEARYLNSLRRMTKTDKAIVVRAITELISNTEGKRIRRTHNLGRGRPKLDEVYDGMQTAARFLGDLIATIKHIRSKQWKVTKEMAAEHFPWSNYEASTAGTDAQKLQNILDFYGLEWMEVKKMAEDKKK